MPGPKHGIARGVAVFGSPGFDEPDRLNKSLADCAALRSLASDHGVALDDEPDSLQVLDGHLQGWRTQPGIGPRLGNEVGQYVGTVIVKHIPGAQWRVWPNGHPVVRLSSGRDLDILAQVEQCVHDRHGTKLTAIYASAR